MYIIQSPLFDFEALIQGKSGKLSGGILEALPAEKLLIALEQEHWTGRKGYSVRGMWPALMAGLLYQGHSLAGVACLKKRDKETWLICGFSNLTPHSGWDYTYCCTAGWSSGSSSGS